MRTYRFQHVDVFTKVQFGGNQLAVFVDGRNLSTEEMQKIAQEMNFPETTFILPPKHAKADWKVRIFTPKTEVPFAWHPTLGTAYVLAKEGMVEIIEPKTTILLELEVGIIPVELEVVNQEIGFIQMVQHIPSFGQELKQVARITEALAIDTQEVAGTGLPVEVVSSGLPFLFIPIKSLQTVENMKPNFALLGTICEELGGKGAFIFAQKSTKQDSTKFSDPELDKEIADLRVHSRMFGTGVGIQEDPATGSASGPLGCYLIKNRVIPTKPKVRIISEQGYEIQRPSILYIEIGMTKNEITDVRVGGYVVPVVEGNLFVE